MATSYEIRIANAQKKAEKLFNQIYNKSEREKKKDILNEVYEQINICDGFCKYVTETEIRDWLQSRSLAHLAVKVRTYKLS